MACAVLASLTASRCLPAYRKHLQNQAHCAPECSARPRARCYRRCAAQTAGPLSSGKCFKGWDGVELCFGTHTCTAAVNEPPHTRRPARAELGGAACRLSTPHPCHAHALTGCWDSGPPPRRPGPPAAPPAALSGPLPSTGGRPALHPQTGCDGCHGRPAAEGRASGQRICHSCIRLLRETNIAPSHSPEHSAVQQAPAEAAAQEQQPQGRQQQPTSPNAGPLLLWWLNPTDSAAATNLSDSTLVRQPGICTPGWQAAALEDQAKGTSPINSMAGGQALHAQLCRAVQGIPGS